MHKTTSRLFGVAYELKSASLRFSNLLPYELCISISGSSDLRFRRPAPVVYVVDSSSSVLHAASEFCMILGGFRVFSCAELGSRSRHDQVLGAGVSLPEVYANCR